MADKQEKPSVELVAALKVLNKENDLEETPGTIRSWKAYPDEDKPYVSVVISDHRKFSVPLAKLGLK